MTFSPAVLALLAFLLAIGLSMTTRINVGLLAMVLAWIVGVYAAGMKVETLLQGFSSSLFVTLLGVTMLFAVAQSNGTLEQLARRVTSMVRGHAGLLPVAFFVVAMLLSTVGPGAVASVALLAPLAMPTGRQAGVPNLLSAIMIGTGANAGNLSPISSVGAMVNGLMARVGLDGHEWKVWATNFAAHVVVAAGAYVLFGGVRLLRSGGDAAIVVATQPLERRHKLTLVVTAAWILAVVVWRVHPGLSALAAGTLLVLLRTVEERDAIARIPLDVILMVTGVTLLISVMESTGGMDLGVSFISPGASPTVVNTLTALVVGVISTYSSTSGVVLPAFLPVVPGIVAQSGVADPLAVALSINVGSALVDVSPLSTLGALCVAAVADPLEARDLFRKLLFWGFSMALVGAVLCGLLAGPIARL
jgi:di/tricarboxylate transporter